MFAYTILHNYSNYIDLNFDSIKQNDFKESNMSKKDYQEYLIDNAQDLKYLDKKNIDIEVPMVVGSGNLSPSNQENAKSNEYI
jgi:hypothetical protein